jgi:DNA mismatch repair protein MutS
MEHLTPMMEQYLSIKADYPDAFLFFRLGDFYELFFDDAKEAAQILEIALTSRPAGKNGQKIPMCGVPYHTAQHYIKKMIDKGHKVAICEQIQDPKEAKGVVERQVIRVITPGTVIEETMLSDRDNHYILFLSCAEHTYGIIASDLSTGEVSGTEVDEWDVFLDETVQFQPKEVILSPSFSKQELDELNQMFTGKTTVVDKLLAEANASHWLLEQLKTVTSNAIKQSLWLMDTYLLETQKKAVEHLQPVQYYHVRSFLALDREARRNLELVETIREKSRKGSLLWVLDETSTAMGGRLLKKWLVRPLIKKDQIEQRLDMVEALMEESWVREAVQTKLKAVYDLERLTARVAYGNASPRDLLQLKQSLAVIPDLISELRQMSQGPLTSAMEALDPCPELVQELEKALREDAPITIKEGGIFKPGYHPELDQLHQASREGKSWITQLEQQERERTGIKSLKIGYNKVFGYYIEVTKANVHLLEEGRYQRKQTLSNAERFITPELKEKEAMILEAGERAIQLEHDLFVDLREKVKQYTDRLQRLAAGVAELDCLSALAEVSEKYQYVRPTFTEDGTLLIKEGRHPVVEQVLPAGQFVANDVTMNDTDRQILLITGPNMAGKSTYMRQLAHIVIMAQMGCFVPAQEAHLPIFDQIFTRIGAHDDLVGGQSTFMAEMMETKRAIMQATSRSLLLLDEIGRGTATYDGMSLAQAVIEYIHQHVQAKTLFSTHYHELTDLENSLPRLKNVHAAAAEKGRSVTFLHKVLDGKADKSYGIHVAELAGLPEEVISRAEAILSVLESKPGSPTSATFNQHDHVQLSLFETDEKPISNKTVRMDASGKNVLQEIEKLDLVNMTPLEALNTLFRLQQIIRGTGVKI